MGFRVVLVSLVVSSALFAFLLMQVEDVIAGPNRLVALSSPGSRFVGSLGFAHRCVPIVVGVKAHREFPFEICVRKRGAGHCYFAYTAVETDPSSTYRPRPMVTTPESSPASSCRPLNGPPLHKKKVINSLASGTAEPRAGAYRPRAKGR